MVQAFSRRASWLHHGRNKLAFQAAAERWRAWPTVTPRNRQTMRILIAAAEDDSGRRLEDSWRWRGHAVLSVPGGGEAWAVLQGESRPRLAILDWMMPGMEGVDMCHKVGADPRLRSSYLILLTSRDRRENILEG